MIWFVVSLLTGVSFITGCTKRESRTDRFKSSYAIGQQLGENLRQQKLDLDIEAIHQGLRDSFDKKSEFTPEQMQTALLKMQQTASVKQNAEAEEHKAVGLNFLEKNKLQDGIKVTKSGLQYQVLRAGSGPSPKTTDIVKCHYRGTLMGGEVFDSSYDRGQPAHIPVTGTLRGWTEVFPLMKVGEKIKLFLPPELGYGASPRPNIPSNSVLIYELELLGIDKPSRI